MPVRHGSCSPEDMETFHTFVQQTWPNVYQQLTIVGAWLAHTGTGASDRTFNDLLRQIESMRLVLIEQDKGELHYKGTVGKEG